MSSAVGSKQYPGAGGGEAVSEGTVSSFFSAFNSRIYEHYSRDSDTLVQAKTVDNQLRIPQWLTRNDNVAVDGSALTPEEEKQSYLGRYSRELAIAEAIQQNKQMMRSESRHSLIGAYNNMLRWLGYAPSISDPPEKVAEEVGSQWDQDVERAARIAAAGGYERHIPSWGTLMESLEQHRPIAMIAEEYRPRIDIYGIDPYLDNGPSVIYSGTKWSTFLGTFHGGVKGTRALAAEGQSVLASGISFFALFNVNVIASALKFGGHGLVFSSMFVLGDRATRAAKRAFLVEHDARQRTPINYSVGFSCALAPTGLAPYWFFRDASLALRYTMTAAATGALAGALVGITMDHLIAVNLSRIAASDRELRRYEALTRRQREWYEAESEQRLLPFSVIDMMS